MKKIALFILISAGSRYILNRKRFFKKLDDDSMEELMCYMKASMLTRGVYKVARKLGIDEKQPWNCIETNKESARKEN